MKQWLNQHRQALRQVSLRLRHNLLATLMMWCVMGVTLSLPAMLYVVVDNLSRLAGNVQAEPQLSLFLKLDASKATVDAIAIKLKQHADVASYQFEPKEHAWQQLQLHAGTAGVADSLEKNPLPDAYFVHPKAVDPDSVDKLQKELQQWDGVELAQADANWIKRLDAILQLSKKAILVLVALLGFALLAIIGNTIRLQILTQREEIEVSKLIGATDRFIRRPFLYAGAFYGLGGGIAAWLLLVGVIQIFNYSVADIAELYASQFSLTLPGACTNSVILASAVALGWLASWIAVGRALAGQKPR